MFRCHPSVNYQPPIISCENGRPNASDSRGFSRKLCLVSIIKVTRNCHSATCLSKPRVRARCWELQNSQWRHISGAQVNLKSCRRQAPHRPPGLGMCPLARPTRMPCSDRITLCLSLVKFWKRWSMSSIFLSLLPLTSCPFYYIFTSIPQLIRSLVLAPEFQGEFYFKTEP